MSVGFNASGDYAKRLGTPLFDLIGDTAKFTMAGWVKLPQLGTGDWSYWLGLESSDTNASSYILHGFNQYDTLEFESHADQTEFTNQPSTNTWYYFYITGSNTGSNTLSLHGGYYTAAGTSPVEDINLAATSEFEPERLDIGNDSWNEFGNVIMAQVRVWTGVVLTDAQLRAERDSPTPVITSGLWASYSLDDNTDTADDSGNGRTLTFGGSLTTEEDPPNMGTDVSDSHPAYTEGSGTDTSSSRAGFLEGIVTTPLVTWIQLAVPIPEGTQDSSSIQAYLRGSETGTSSLQAYTAGLDSAISSQQAFLQGSQDTNTSVQAYTAGQDTAQAAQPAYTAGQDVSTSSQSAFLHGSADTTSSQQAYIEGAAAGADVDSSLSAFTAGKTQYALRPDADINDGVWKDQADGTNLFEAINEPSWIDTDYAWDENAKAGDSFEVGLTNPGYTVGAGDHIIRWRAARIANTKTVTMKCELVQGVTVIASDQQVLTANYQTFEYSLSAPEIANITDYNNLRLRFTIVSIA